MRDPCDDYLVPLARDKDVDMIVRRDWDLFDWEELIPPVVTRHTHLEEIDGLREEGHSPSTGCRPLKRCHSDGP
jgi:hypothetical protein